jgi:hypothetical protein
MPLGAGCASAELLPSPTPSPATTASARIEIVIAASQLAVHAYARAKVDRRRRCGQAAPRKQSAAQQLNLGGWKRKLRKNIPSCGHSLIDNAALARGCGRTPRVRPAERPTP